MRVLTVHSNTAALRPADMVAGRDLALRISESDGLVAPPGVYVGDELTPADKLEIDRVAGAVLSAWRAIVDEALTVDGFCLPFAWELEVVAGAILPTLRAVSGVRAALERWSPAVLELDDDLYLADALAAVVRSAAPDVEVRLLQGEAIRLLGHIPRSPQTIGTRILGAVDYLGIPSCVRRGAIVVAGYWSMAAALDELLASPGHLPAAMLTMRPPGTFRTLAAMRQGGWIGVPGRRATERARRDVAGALGACPPVESIEAFGVDVGPAVHRAASELAMRRGAADLAVARLVRSVLRTSRVSTVLLPYDSTPEARLVVTAARENGVRTIALAHAGYWFPAIVQDLEVADEIAVWSMQALDHIGVNGRKVYVAGYPNGRRPAPVRARPPGRAPRVVVLDQPELPLSAVIDARMSARHYQTAVRAVSRAAPEAIVVLRPHPSRGHATAAIVRALFPGVEIELAGDGTILEIFRDADLCIGSASTATLEAAYAGVPVVVLDLTGVEWPWPLGGATDVPVVRDEDELATAVGELLRSGAFPGRESLLEAVGAMPETAVSRPVEYVPASLPRSR